MRGRPRSIAPEQNRRTRSRDADQPRRVVVDAAEGFGGRCVGRLQQAVGQPREYAVVAREPEAGLASLEIKVSFLDRVDVAPFEAKARVPRRGRSTAFLEADLFAQDGLLCARAVSTGKLLRPRG